MAHRTDRKLAAILAADVIGYWRLMGRDEEGGALPAAPLVLKAARRGVHKWSLASAEVR